ncbi:MAG: hypothetical protein A2231_01210 [Candidatus Firestonebacteria bacterium RIFOXYA2_FULL_40_8]|nr:MAG: hypothetical protein A2231_01210 [Candidatus Firestonebacteria bacterium RIFOXYA2_FULL_40_8]
MLKNKIVRNVLIVAGVLIALNLLYVLFNGGLSRRSSGNMNILTGGNVGVINVYGPLYNSKTVCETLRKFNNNPSIKAVVLRIDSPGGGVAVCQEINREIYEVKKNKKIVVASFGSIAASGGYYIGCAANAVFSNPGTLTGSIGVIISYFNFEELFKKIGISQVVIKSGKFKDMASMSRKMTPEEEELLQGVIDNVYSQFVDTIVLNRSAELKANLIKLKGIKEPTSEEIRESVTSIADGRIFSGKQALEYGLVDRLGTFEDAVVYAADAAGIKGEPVLVYEKKKINFMELLSGSEETDSMVNKFFFKGMCYLYGE